MERREANAVAVRLRWAAALTAAGLALSGCGAGTNAQTGEMVPAISGVNADAGTLAMRDMKVDFGDKGFYPEGGQAPLQIWIDNQGAEPVVLEGVTSSAADAVVLVTAADGSEEPSPEPDASPTGEESPGDDEASPSEQTSEQPSEEPTGVEEPSDEGAQESIEGERDFEIEFAPSSYMRLTPERGTFLMLDGLSRDVFMGSMVDLTFVFSNGETVTVDLLMGVPNEPEPRTYFEPHHEEGAE